MTTCCGTPPASPAQPGRRRLLLAGAAALAAGCAREEEIHLSPAAGPAASVPAPALHAGIAPRPVGAPDLRADAVLLPGLINGSSDGPFIDLVRAIEAVYARGRIEIDVVPDSRLCDGVSRGSSDFGFPAINASPVADPGRPYRYSSVPFGWVSFVIYSHRERPVRRADLLALGRGENRLRVESTVIDWGFPVLPFTSFESAFRKVEAGRIDALLWAQEEADHVLRGLGLVAIHRALYARFQDVFLLPRGARGEFVDRVLGDALRTLQAQGRLEPLYERIHRPFDPWQPTG